jgi:hypothetical protein
MAEGEEAGSPGSPAGSATVDWSKGGAEHFGAFRESLGDVGKDKALEPIKDFHGLAKSFVDSQKMIGRGIYLPKENATPEEKTKAANEITEKLRKAGILETPPDSPEKYQINLPEKDFQGQPFEVNQPLLDSFRGVAHKLGVSPKVAQGLFDWYLNFQAEAEAGDEKAFEEMKSGLKKEWGGLYTRNMEAARRAVFKYVGEDGDSVISSLPPQIGFKLVKAFSQIGDGLLEDDIVTGNLAGVPSVDDVQKKISTMMNDKKHPLNDASHPGHKVAVQEYNKLNDTLSRLQLRMKAANR